MVDPSQFPSVESGVVIALELLNCILKFSWKCYRERVHIVDGPCCSLKVRLVIFILKQVDAA
jgi:hypothetical protein